MTDNEQLDTLVKQLINASDPEEVKALYRQWATTYNSDLDSFGYVAPQLGAALFDQKISNRQGSIHDAGCGTGLVGQLLNKLGYDKIDGSDFSPDMLSQAAQTGCYRNLLQADYAQPVDIENNSYDGVISIGVYTKRFSRHYIAEMLRIVKPGGHFVFTCRPLYYEEVARRITQLHVEDVIESSSVSKDDYMLGQGASAYYVSLQKTGD